MRWYNQTGNDFQVALFDRLVRYGFSIPAWGYIDVPDTVEEAVVLAHSEGRLARTESPHKPTLVIDEATYMSLKVRYRNSKLKGYIP